MRDNPKSREARKSQPTQAWQRLAGGPDRQNCGQSRQTPPFAHNVMDIEQFRAGDSESAAWQIVWPSEPGRLSFSIPTAMRKAGSPIKSAGVCFGSTSCQVRLRLKALRRDLHFSRTGMRVRVCVLRGTGVPGKALHLFDGLLRMMRRLRTCFFEAMARSARIAKSSMRWYSMAGIMATSTLPLHNCSAHCEGHVKDKSYLPRSGRL